jgi:peptidyl-prolyl cis-trans isomerase D
MISFIRRLFNSKVGLAFTFVFIGLVAFAFAAGDISNTGGLGSFTGNSGTVAKVGDGSISSADLQSRTQMVFDRNRQQRPDLEMTEFMAAGGLDNVLDQLVQGLALTEYAGKQGMHASKRLIDGEIASIPAFKDASGNFSEQLYRNMLQQQRITDAALRQDIARDIYSRQILAPVTMGSRISVDMTKPYASLLLEAREGRISVIPAKLFLSNDQPAAQELAEFYRRNADRFTVPEQRQLRYVLIDKARFEKSAAPGEAEIARYYEENKANYAAREARTLAQLIVPTQAAANVIAAKVKGGASLADAAKSAGLAVATLNDLSEQQYAEKSSAAVAKGAFATAKGDLAPIAKSPLGWHVVQVTEVTTTPARSLAAVRAEITAALQEQKAAEAMANFLATAEDQIAEGTTFEEFAKDASLPIKATPALLRNGSTVEQADYQAPPELRPLLEPAFGMELDDEPQMVTISPDQLYALVDVTEIKAAAPPPLDKVRDVIVQQFQLERASARAKAAADQVVAKMAKGADFAKALAETGLKVPPPQPIGGKRADIARGGQQVPPPLALLFSMVEGSTKRLEAGNDQGWFVVKLDKIQRGDAGNQPDLVNAVRQEMSRVAGNEYAEQFTRAVQQHVGVKKNETAIAEVKRQLRGATSGQ